MVCNGELALYKPSSHYVTGFYPAVAGGGALGGMLVALAAPKIHRGFWSISLWLSALLLATILVRDEESWLYRSKIGSPVLVFGITILLPESAALR
jgi:hypothetical protein